MSKNTTMREKLFTSSEILKAMWSAERELTNLARVAAERSGDTKDNPAYDLLCISLRHYQSKVKILLGIIDDGLIKELEDHD